MSPHQRATPENVKAAYDELAAEPGAWVSIADLRDRLPNIPREDLDRQLRELNRQPGVGLVPESEQTSMTQRERDAGLQLGGQHKHNIRFEPPDGLDALEDRQLRSLATEWEQPTSGSRTQLIKRLRAAGATSPQARQAQASSAKPMRDQVVIGVAEPQVSSDQGRAAQRLASTRSGGDGLEALRDQLRVTTDADRRDTLVQRIVQLSDAGKADQPREVTRDQIQQAYAELAGHPGELVSLARLRDRLKHVKHTELTAALKEMDRQRLLQLDPDPNRKALPAEAHEAAVRLGDEDKHFLSIIGVGGR